MKKEDKSEDFKTLYKFHCYKDEKEMKDLFESVNN